MRIVLDARMYGLKHAGIGRYVLNLVNELEKRKLEDDFYILLRKESFDSLNFKNPKIKKVKAEIAHYGLSEQIVLPFLLKRLKPDLVHFPHFNIPLFWLGRYVVTIHDLIKHESKGKETTTRLQVFYWLKFLLYRLIVFSSIKRAKKIIVPSDYWKKKLAKNYSLSEKKIMTTYEGADDFLKKQKKNTSDLILKKFKIDMPFVVYTGSLYPHKNIERLAKAIRLINKEKNLLLVIVCGRNVFWKRFKNWLVKEELGSFVKLLGFVDDSDLFSLYQKAEAFAFPSLLEGFGLPPLEAMAAGLPVVSSNATCLPEIYGNAAYYFDPLSVSDMAKSIEKVIFDKKLQEELKKRGAKQVKLYSWEKMVDETLRIYHSEVIQRKK
ncbi:glycosyltransferase family 4 protein [Patescibacteria group bacterium]|nr:glycosyltransferase family 4 protein [Patescibacteria group bacterium]